jgi:argininosuccinate synthase
MFQMTTAPEKAPAKPEYVQIGFSDGVPVSVNGETLPPVKLLGKLNEIAGRHGVGRVDIVENRFIGMKSRGVYETPGGTLLHIAHRGIESITMDREIMHLRDLLMPKFSELVYNGFWFSPETQSMLSFIQSTQKGVTGTARMKLYKGSAVLVGRKSPRPGYDPELASFEQFANYSSSDAGGFIRMNALRLIQNPNLKWQS